MNELVTLLQGDCLTHLKNLPDRSIQCCVTSPPYWNLRDYCTDGQLGLEKTPQEYVEKMTEVLREVRRVLKEDGTLWINLGDSYATNGGAHGGRDDNQRGVGAKLTHESGNGYKNPRRAPNGLKPKDLVGIPWRVAFALQADGWYLRQDIIWHKPNPMPESVTDRCTKAHEYIFLMSKQERYYYDAEAIKEPVTGNAHARGNGVNPNARLPGNVNPPKGQLAYENGDHLQRTKAGLLDYAKRVRARSKQNESFSAAVKDLVSSRNKRSVWTVPSAPFKGAHFATFPPNLIKPCILAGTKPGDTVLDPFGGSGTTGQVAIELGRKAILIELNPDYGEMIKRRTDITPGLALI